MKTGKRNIARLAVALVLAPLAAAALAFAAGWAFIDWEPEEAATYPGGVILRDAAGNVMRVSLGEGDLDCRPFYTASKDDWIVKALIAAEDGEFWRHCGVRPLSILRAAFQNVTSARRISGASTITMQTVRLVSPHQKTFFWKFAEAIKAMKMERQKDKLWILSQYLNRAPFGSNLAGIEAAANGWFGKSAKELGIGEAACLAGMVQAPSRFRPDRHLERALKRRSYVLKRMEKLGFITQYQREAAESVRPVVKRAPRPFSFPYYCDWALSCRQSEQQAYADVATALDCDIQRECESVVENAARSGRYSAAAAVMRVEDGAIVALACSGDYFSDAAGKVNTALAPRPAGSTLKPFLSALAFDRGLATPETRLLDVPCSYPGYRPANFDGKYRGIVSLSDALVLSLNIPFVRLLEKMGVGDFGTVLRSLGLKHMSETDESYGLGMAIGNVHANLIELVGAYGTLARGGVFLPPNFGQSRADDSKPHENVRIFSNEATYLVSDILSGDERSLSSLGHIADVDTARFAWKTGTSAAHRDAWCIAWNPKWVIGVWCGHIAGSFGDTSLVGAKASAPACWQIVRHLYPRNDGEWFAEPEDIGRREVCARTGLSATPDCPETLADAFIRGKSTCLACSSHSRSADGAPVTHDPPELAAFLRAKTASRRLSIVKPERGAVFSIVPDMPQQKLICVASGLEGDVRLWWFEDARPIGTSLAGETFLCDLAPGRHVISCSTASGLSATTEISVESLAPVP